jgi:DNA (cytosine-5)-methyltransferase 1
MEIVILSEDMGSSLTDREGGSLVRMDEDTTKTLDAASGLNPTCSQGGTAVMQPIIGGVDYENNAHGPDDVTGPLLKGSPTGGGRPLPAIALQSMAVRRLTPVECERLQGFPDGYTNIPWRKNPESPDGPRYKALGNSWAVPNVRWIGKRIQEALNALP